MTSASSELTTCCPSCGQLLAFVVLNLPAYSRCPRCKTKHSTADLVGQDVALPAVPASAPPSVPTSAETPYDKPGPGIGDNKGFTIEEQRRGVHGFTEDAVVQFTAFSHAVLVVCGRIDRKVEGHRVLLLFLFAASSNILGPILDGVFDNRGKPLGAAAAIFTAVFMMLAWLLAFAFAGNLRAEDGSWRFSVVLQRFRASWIDVIERFQEFSISTKSQRYKLAAIVLLGLGMVMVATFQVVRLTMMALHQLGIDGSWNGAEWLGPWGWVLSAAGLFAYLASRLSRPLANTMSARDGAASRRAASTLPYVLRLQGRSAEFGDDTDLHEVLRALSQWRARTHYSEREYQNSLSRHLERKLSTMQIEQEKRLTIDGKISRADLVLGDSVLLELKRGASRASEQHRMVGQAWGYGRSWTKGPIILVLFETRDDDFVPGYLTSELGRLHDQLQVLTVRMPVTRGKN